MKRPEPSLGPWRMARTLAAVVACCIALPIQAAADDLRDPVAVAAEMTQLPVDAPVKLFQKFVSDRITAEFKPRIAEAADPLVKDTLNRQLFQAVHAVQKTWWQVVSSGASTSWKQTAHVNSARCASWFGSP